MRDEAAAREHEVVVVGARCAGAAVAMLLARQGHDVAVVDRATFPSDTLSTHAIARGGVVQLARWGLLDDVVASGAPPIRNVSFHANGQRIDRPVKLTAGVDHLIAPRRYSATHYAYVAGLDAATDSFEFHVGHGAFAGVFSTHASEANVWVCHQISDDGAVPDGKDRAASFLSLLDSAAPDLARRVRAADLTSPVRASIRFPNQVRQAAGRGWALAGDAGYARDPITGHGITDAFRDAELLARHAGQFLRGQQTASGASCAYAYERDRALRSVFELTSRLTTYPAPATFTELQVQLSKALEEEATWLAERSPLAMPERTAAA